MTSSITNEAIRAFEALKKGGTILYPTDTIWGIGCDAKNEKAINKIYQIKHRPESKSLIILLSDKESLSKYVEKVPLIALDLMDQIDKPLTIIYPKAKNLLSSILTDGSIAIRIQKTNFVQNLSNC